MFVFETVGAFLLEVMLWWALGLLVGIGIGMRIARWLIRRGE